MVNIAWYLKRLRVMRPAEIVHRVAEQFRLKKMHAAYRLNGGRGPVNAIQWGQCVFCTSSAPQLPELPWSFNYEEEAVSRFMDGHVGALGYKWRWRDMPGVWHEAPDSGERWPQRFFGAIPYLAGNPFGDIRVAWEPSRLQHLIELALIADSGGDQHAIEAVQLLERQFLSWCKDNPAWCGIHYISAMECGLRIIAVAYALDMTRGRLVDSVSVWSGYTQLVESHARLIERRLSLHSSLGNHTIAECAGLVYAGILFPEMKDAALWLETGLSILEAEASHQILPDGGGVEQSFWYHLFVLDLYGLVAALLTSRLHTVPLSIEDALERGRNFLGNLGTAPGNLPAVGDGDSGFALSRYLNLGWQGSSIKKASLVTFNDAGYTIIRCSARPGLKLLMDHGNLGKPPSYGHGHADALSVIVRLGGKELLTDSGTYTYTGDPLWRNYFRSTRAHNTVCIDGLDQSRQETAFLWSHPFHAELLDSIEGNDGEVRLLARHDGYLHVGVTHWRSVIVKPSGVVWILDYLDGTGEHECELNWHLDAKVTWRDGAYIAELESGSVVMEILGGELAVASGQMKPIIAWKSDCYGCKKPSTAITCKYQGSLPHEFMTVVAPEDQYDASLLDMDMMHEMKRWIR